MNVTDRLSYASRVFKKSGSLIQLTMFITSRCNLRCTHCFYWKELDSDHSHELRIDEIHKIADSLPRLLVLSLTGGESFVRQDIDEIYGTFATKTRTPIITISTNGFYLRRMEELIPKMLEKHPNTSMLLYLSVDGPQELNDEIRGEYSWDKAMDCLEMLQPLRKRFPNLGISISMTCNRLNQDHLKDTFLYFKNSGKVDNVNIGFVRGEPKDPAVKQSVSIEKYREITDLKVNAIDSEEMKYFNLYMKKIVSSKDYYTYKIVEDVMLHDKWVLPCQAGSLFGIMYDDGSVHPCEILKDSKVANIRDYDYDLPKLWASQRAEELRKQIKNGCHCTFECAMSSSILFNPKYLAKIALKTMFKKWRNSKSTPTQTPKSQVAVPS